MSNNPYQTPESQVASAEEGFAEVKFFSPGGRINRLRYWAHGFLIAIPFYFVAGIAMMLGITVSPVFFGIVAIAYVALAVCSVIFMIQRLHDLNKSGWLSLLMIIPIVNFYPLILMVFFRGTEGRNDYGLPPPPNKTWHWVMAFSFVFVALIGILAAISIPAYQQYVEKAKAAQSANGQ